MRASILPLVLVAACGAPVRTLPAPGAWTPPAVATHESPALVIRARAYVDVAAGTLVAPARIVIDDGRITAIGEGPAPEGGCTVDLGDAVLLPGLIDAHSHLLHLSDARDASESAGMIVETAELSDADRALRGARYAREMLRAGFTAVRDVGNSGDGGDLALRDAIARGDVLGPRMFVTTRALAGERGQFERLGELARPIVEHEYAVVSGEAEARAAVRAAIARGADGIKIIVGSETAIRLSLEEVTAIVDEAHRAGRWVAAHATDDAGAAIAARGGVDSIEHGYELSDETLAIMAEGRVALVPTDFPIEMYRAMVADARVSEERRARAEAFFQGFVAAHHDRIARARAHGITIVAGSDAYYRWDERDRGQIAASIFRAYAEAGMPPDEILRAATVSAAHLLGQDERLGEIAVDHLGDVIAVLGDPLTDVAALEHVVFVARGGTVVRDDVSGACGDGR